MSILTKIFNKNAQEGINGAIVSRIDTYYSISEYLDRHDIRLNTNQKMIATQMVSDLSRQRNIQVINDFEKGYEVTRYHIDVLREAINNHSTSDNKGRIKTIAVMKLGINHDQLINRIEVNLENKGLNLGMHHQGSPDGLVNSLRMIHTDYESDIHKLNIEHRDKLIEEIHAFEMQAIKCNNQLRHLNENLIPDKIHSLEELEEQLKHVGAHGLDSFVEMANSSDSEIIPIWMMQKLNYKKNLNEFKAKVISLENETEQHTQRIFALKIQLETSSYYNNYLLKNRLETFYNGWLKSYAFFEINKDDKKEAAMKYETLKEEILSQN